MKIIGVTIKFHMPDDLKHIYFDMCVNQGKGRAVKILQRAG